MPTRTINGQTDNWKTSGKKITIVLYIFIKFTIKP